jgi:hypothetical protein
METLLALGAIVLALLYFWLVFYGSRQRWMRDQTKLWAGASLASLISMVIFAFTAVASNGTLWVIATTLMLLVGFVAFISWDEAICYNQRWAAE